MRHRALAAVLVIANPLFVTGCSDEPSPAVTSDATSPAVAPAAPPAPRPPATPATFVGRASCAGCHEQETAMFAGSDHDRAMAPADETTVLGDFDDTVFTAYGDTSTFSRREDGFYVTTGGPDGEQQEFRIVYTFGVRPLQQYLIEMPGGRLQVLSLCWDTRPESDGGQRWFHLYPDERIDHRDLLHWTALSQNWNYMCAECHSTRLRKNYRPAEDRFETTWSEIDVSCEACHGPGSRHAEWAERIANGEIEGGDPSDGLVVRLRTPDESYWVFDEGAPTARRTAPLEPNVQVETCGRCHSRRSQVWEDYRHGRPLADTHRVALLDEALYHADGQILDEVYVYGSFLQSKMYHAGVTCNDCHEPHSARPLAEGKNLCARCHQPAAFDTPEHHHHEPDTPGAACVACHMSERNYMVVDPRRDHSFRVPRPDLSLALGTPNACTDCHADQSAQWALEAVEDWYGPERSERFHYGEALHAGRAGQANARALLSRVVDDPEAPAIARATALELLRPHPGPETAAAIERGARDADPLVRRTAAELLGVLEPQTRLHFGVQLVDDPVRTVRLAAIPELADVPPAILTAAQRERVERAIDEYRLAQAFNADRPESHLNLGNLDRRLGNLTAAERAFRTAISMQPEFVPAYVNLADLFKVAGRDGEGVDMLYGALASTGDNAAVHYALALSLIRLQRREEALEHLAAAVAQQPDNTHYAFVHAIALHDVGQLDAALRVLESAHDRAPADRSVLLTLVSYNAERGDRAAALHWARKAAALWPDDASIRQMLEALE